MQSITYPQTSIEPRYGAFYSNNKFRVHTLILVNPPSRCAVNKETLQSTFKWEAGLALPLIPFIQFWTFSPFYRNPSPPCRVNVHILTSKLCQPWIFPGISSVDDGMRIYLKAPQKPFQEQRYLTHSWQSHILKLLHGWKNTITLAPADQEVLDT